MIVRIDRDVVSIMLVFRFLRFFFKKEKNIYRENEVDLDNKDVLWKLCFFFFSGGYIFWIIFFVIIFIFMLIFN